MKIFTLLLSFLFASKVVYAVNPKVLIKTNQGEIEVELFHDKAPVSVDNFLKYVDDKFYTGTIFHRVIKNFMIQGGGFDKNMSQKSTKSPIKNEANNGLKNEAGTLAMARTNDINSATAQFFINAVDNDFLNYQGPANFGYAVFGKVTKGMPVVKKIEMTKTTFKGGMQDVPEDAIIIEEIKRL